MTEARDSVCFRSGQPIWPNGREEEMNLHVGFRAVFQVGAVRRTILRVAGASVYRVFVNGAFRGHGPARGPHGYYRVDEWDLTGDLVSGTNLVAVEVAGYNANSYYLLDQPSFLQAEVVSEEDVLASTAGDGAAFEAAILPERMQRVPRYSFQRPFTEVYRLQPGYDTWRNDAAASMDAVSCSVLPAKNLIPRRVPYPTFSKRRPVWHVASGNVGIGPAPEEPRRDPALSRIGEDLAGYAEADCEIMPILEVQKLVTESREEHDKPSTSRQTIALDRNSYRILDLGTNLTGFLGFRVRCESPSRVFLTFDEVLTDGDVDFLRMNCENVLTYELAPGRFEIESLEPYTLRYLKLIVLDGDCEIDGVYLREYVNPDVWSAHFSASDPRLNRLFEAGRETFRQNAVDIFMDCPSRERAGWLCDSFFTARVALDLCGNTTVEQAFYENFLLPDRFPHLPDGMLPMCYPADHRNGNFIPNWALWFVVELEEYLARSGDRAMVDALKAKVLALFDYFQPFLNEDGLLEKLERWVFVEWSEANRLVQDVNYPTNMLYAGALSAAGRMYGLPKLEEQADTVRHTIRQQSFDGSFFVDNAVRKNGALEVTTNRTEVCQYYAFFFDVATPGSHADLWRVLVEDFGPHRKDTGKFPDVHTANAFIGNYLRLELLSRHGRCAQLLEECRDYFLYMAERTGTLWEHTGASASCNHGFASHVVHALYRDVLGLQEIDRQGKHIRLRFADLPLDWCEGRVPLGSDAISLRWWKEGDALCYRIDAPAGYAVEAEDLDKRELKPHP